MTTFEHTAGDALAEAHATAPPGMTRLICDADSTRGEVDALGIAHGGDVLIMHGGTFREGPAYYVWIEATTDAHGGFVPYGQSTYGDSYEEAVSAAHEWVHRRTFTAMHALRRDGGEQ